MNQDERSRLSCRTNTHACRVQNKIRKLLLDMVVNSYGLNYVQNSLKLLRFLFLIMWLVITLQSLFSQTQGLRGRH